MVNIDNIGLMGPVEFILGQFLEIIFQWGANQEFFVDRVHFQINIVGFYELDIAELNSIIQVLFFNKNGIL